MGLMIMPCRRCIGGQVITDNGETRCIHCGAEHTPSGELVKPEDESPNKKQVAHGSKKLCLVR